MEKKTVNHIRCKLTTLFSRNETTKLVLLFFSILFMGLFEVVGVASIGPFMAVVTSPELIHENEYLRMVHQFFGYPRVSYFLASMGGLVLVALMLSNGYTALVNGWIIYFSNMQEYRLSMRLLEKYLAQPYIFHLNRNTADLGKNILSEVRRCIAGVILPGIQAASRVVLAVFILIFLLILNPILAVSVFVVLGLTYGLVFQLARQYLHKIGKLSTVLVLERYKIVNEAMSGIKDLKLRGSEWEFLSRFASPSEEYARYASYSSMISTLPKYIVETIALGGVVAIVIYLINIGQGGEQIIPLISLYALAGYRLMPALQQIYACMTKVKYHLPVLDILVDDLSGQNDGVALYKRKANPLPFEQGLKLENICFFYPNVGRPVVDGLNLNITPNTTIGLIGATGSGKTTLVDIILGLLTPESGKIIVDGTEITHKNNRAWQSNIGYVPQAIYLTDDTIEHNIAFAIPDDEIDMDRVKESAKLAELDNFIHTLPEKYKTYVGERGVRLSGGQRQRIGIARALYCNPKILVLDEATSALDGITENVIMDAIHNLSHKKTIIIVAHRLSTVEECDVIYMLDQGKIVASGTYEELIANNERFKKMANV